MPAGDGLVGVPDSDPQHRTLVLQLVLVGAARRAVHPKNRKAVHAVIVGVVTNPRRQIPEDAVPLGRAEVVGDPLGDQEFPVALDSQVHVVVEDLLLALGAGGRRQQRPGGEDEHRQGTSQPPHGPPP
jgi:hypothetical protein